MTISLVNPSYSVSRTSPPSHVKALFEGSDSHKPTEVSKVAHLALTKGATDTYIPLSVKPKSSVRSLFLSTRPAVEARPALSSQEEKIANTAGSATSSWLRTIGEKTKSAIESGASSSTRMLCSQESRSAAEAVGSSLYEAGEITVEVLKALAMIFLE